MLAGAIQGSAWECWHQIFKFIKAHRRKMDASVCARTLEEPGSWSRVAGIEISDSPVGGLLSALGASGLS